MSAILLGGNVLVKNNSDVGGTFQHIPACRTITDLGCVIAFSTFDQPVPFNSPFGRTTAPGEHVLCVNPVAIQGRSRDVDPILPWGPIAVARRSRARISGWASVSLTRRRCGRACRIPTAPAARLPAARMCSS